MLSYLSHTRLTIGLWLLLATPLPAADNWPEFRGPRGDGWAADGDPPIEWSETRNVKWKVDIHDRGWSSPVIWKDQIWMTTATEDGKKMYAVCVDRETGRIEHDIL